MGVLGVRVLPLHVVPVFKVSNKTLLKIYIFKKEFTTDEFSLQPFFFENLNLYLQIMNYIKFIRLVWPLDFLVGQTDWTDRFYVVGKQLQLLCLNLLSVLI